MKNEALTTLSLPYRDGQYKTVRVFVPAHEEGERLPVVYMTDGQNLFEDDHPGQLGCWYTREAVREEHNSSGRGAIIVGIHNDGDPVQRTNELTPKSIGAIVFPPKMPKPLRKLLKPEGEFFDAFVVQTVMPAVAERFPVKAGRRYTAFCGSSSGGLQTYFTALSHPDLFCAAGVFSPAFPLYAADDTVSWTQARLTEPMPYLYIYSGAADPLEQDICESTGQVYDGISVFYPPEKMCEVILPEQRHHESAWAPIFRDFLHTFLSRGETF